MILKQTETLGYWLWVTEEDKELSPMFLTKTAARNWKELIFKEVAALNKQQPESVSEECTCDNCGCN